MIDQEKEELSRCEWWSIRCSEYGFGLPGFYSTLPSAMGILAYLRRGVPKSRIYTLVKIERPEAYGEENEYRPTYCEKTWHIDEMPHARK